MKGPEGEQRYSFTFSLTSALDVVGGQHHAPANLPYLVVKSPRRYPYFDVVVGLGWIT
jgi:hypothetical protein